MASPLSGRAATVVVAAGQWLAALAILTLGRTEPIPVHFSFAGAVDRWGDRREVALVAGGVALLTLFGGLGMELLSRRRGDPPDASLRITRRVLLVTTSLAVALITALGFGLAPSGASSANVLMGVVSLLLATVGAYLGKVGPNPLMGIRTPWTGASRLAWDKSNRLAGRLLFWGGLAGLAAAPLAPQPAGFRLLIAWAMTAAIACVFESWRVWRTDPERRSAF